MKYFKYFILIFLCVISFYLSDQVIMYVENISPIMKQIKECESEYNVEPVDAVIEGNTIIPGIKGSVVNTRESYLKMNEFGVFNENFFVYDYIDPKVSLKDNKDKIIIGSNKLDSVAIIIDDWKYRELLTNYDYTFVIKDISDYQDYDNVEFINGATNDYKSINNLLKRKKEKSNYILAEFSNVQDNENKYIISPTIDIYSSNLALSLTKIKGGEIIYIHDNVSFTEFKYLIEKIKYKNLKVMKLSNFISE